MIEKFKDNIAAFKEKPLKNQIIIALPYLIVILCCCRIVELYRLCNGNLVKMIRNVEYLYKVAPNFVLSDLLIGIPAGYFIVWHTKWKNKLHRKNMRPGEEYGGAKWGTPDDIKPYIDPDPFYNIILSATEKLSMQARMSLFKLNRNKHVLVYGGSGSGKTFGIVKPNMMQLHSSYVVTDPNG